MTGWLVLWVILAVFIGAVMFGARRHYDLFGNGIKTYDSHAKLATVVTLERVHVMYLAPEMHEDVGSHTFNYLSGDLEHSTFGVIVRRNIKFNWSTQDTVIRGLLWVIKGFIRQQSFSPIGTYPLSRRGSRRIPRILPIGLKDDICIRAAGRREDNYKIRQIYECPLHGFKSLSIDLIGFPGCKVKEHSNECVNYKKTDTDGFNKRLISTQPWKALGLFIGGWVMLVFGWLWPTNSRKSIRIGGLLTIIGGVILFVGTIMLLSWYGDRIVDEPFNIYQVTKNLSCKVLRCFIHPNLSLSASAPAHSDYRLVVSVSGPSAPFDLAPSLARLGAAS